MEAKDLSEMAQLRRYLSLFDFSLSKSLGGCAAHVSTESPSLEGLYDV